MTASVISCKYGNYCHVFPSVSRDQYTALPLEEVLVTWYGRISYIYTFWYNFDTVLHQFLESGTSDRCPIGLNQLLRFSGFSLYPLSFFLYSTFNVFKNMKVFSDWKSVYFWQFLHCFLTFLSKKSANYFFRGPANEIK